MNAGGKLNSRPHNRPTFFMLWLLGKSGAISRLSPRSVKLSLDGT
jgi:hypothetical protein